MNLSQVYQQFIEGMKQTSLPEYLAVLSGIASVWYSRKENILVYPVGLISTVIYIYLSFNGSLFGEAAVNFYYTVMSIYGWILWTKKDNQKHYKIVIAKSANREWVIHLVFFAFCYIIIFIALSYLKKEFAPGAIPLADGFASATAFTGMWLMAKKKVESWYLWIVTNIASIPLYFIKGYVFTSVYYLVLLAMAFWGLSEWKKKANKLQMKSAKY